MFPECSQWTEKEMRLESSLRKNNENRSWHTDTCYMIGRRTDRNTDRKNRAFLFVTSLFNPLDLLIQPPGSAYL